MLRNFLILAWDGYLAACRLVNCFMALVKNCVHEHWKFFCLAMMKCYVLYYGTNLKCLLVLRRAMQSLHVLSSEAPNLMLCHDRVGSRWGWSFDPLWATGWHEQCGRCPGRCVAWARLESDACWRVFTLSIYREAVDFVALFTRCFLMGYPLVLSQ